MCESTGLTSRQSSSSKLFQKLW